MRPILFTAVIEITLAIGSPSIAQKIPYQSNEFRDGDSPIPVIFACMFAGHQTGLDVKATETAMDFMLGSGVTPEQVDTWGHDATIYISQELGNIDLAEFWRSSCEEPFRNLRAMLSK